jgi:hypothetical protein
VYNELDNILQEIYVDGASDYGSIVFKNENIQATSKRITTLDNAYRFYLTDENGRSIDLNGRNFVMSIILFEVDHTFEMIKKYIQMKAIQ